MKEFQEHYDSVLLAEYTLIFMGILVIASASFIRKHADPKKFRFHTYISIYCCYIFSGGIIILAPTDLALTVVGRREDYNLTLTTLTNSSEEVNQTIYAANSKNIFVLYNFFFWPCVLLGSVIMPFQEKYNSNYYFARSQRLKSTAKSMLKIYLIACLSGGAVIIFLITKKIFSSVEALMAMVKAFSNTAGLAVIVFLLGYGLVELPRVLWRQSNYKTQLSSKKMEVASEYKKLTEATLDCRGVVANAIKTSEAVHRMRNQTLIDYVKVIRSECPEEFQSGSTGQVAQDGSGGITVHTLSELRCKVNQCRTKMEIHKYHLEKLKMSAFFIEDLLTRVGEENDELSPSEKKKLYRYYFVYRKFFFRSISICFWIMSALFLAAYIGVMFGYDNSMSLFTMIVHDEKMHIANVTVFCLVMLGYFTLVVFWSLSQIRVIGAVEGGKRTTPAALSQNARFICKLVPPIVFSFFGLIFENGLVKGEWVNDSCGIETDTAYARLFDDMTLVPLFGGDKFNTYFPLLIVFLCVVQLLNLTNRILVRLGLVGWQFGCELVDFKTMQEGEQQLRLFKLQMAKSQRRAKTKEILLNKTNALQTIMFNQKNETEENMTTSSGKIENSQRKKGPPKINGWVEKKAPRQMKTKFLRLSAWQNRMFMVREPGILFYYSTADTSKQAKGSVDLSIVLAINFHEDASKKVDKCRLNLSIADREFKLRFCNEKDCARWKGALTEWRTYHLAQKDLESSSPSITQEETSEIVVSPLSRMGVML